MNSGSSADDVQTIRSGTIAVEGQSSPGLKTNSMDLTKSYPRSPRERLGGIPMLPRTIDKARAAIAGTLGEYKYGESSDFDMYLFETLGVDAESFLDGVRRSPDDAAVLRWLHANARTVAERDDERLLETLERDGVDSDDGRAQLDKWTEKNVPPPLRARIRSWVDKLDFDEGRIT